MRQERFYEIDLLRFIAAALVVMFHYTFRGYAADAMTVVAYPGLGQIFRYGYLGVDLFFMISGFVIMLSARHANARKFLISRITRLYPAYWFGVSLTALVTLFWGGARYHVGLFQYLANLTMAHSLLGLPVEDVDGAYWSLAVELKFYLLIFMILIFGLLDKFKYFLIAWLLITVLLLSYDHFPMANFWLFPQWSAYFIAGAILSYIREEGLNIRKGMLLIACYVVALQQAEARAAIYSLHYQALLDPRWIALIISAMFLLLLAISCGWLRLRGSLLIVQLGAMTYPLYLMHQNIGFMLMNHLYRHLEKHVLLLLAIIVMLSLAYAVHHWIEQPYSAKLKTHLRRILLLDKSWLSGKQET